LADPARITAHRILTKSDLPEQFVDRVLQRDLNRSPLPPQSRRWITEVVLGTTRWQLQLDFLIRQVFRGNYNKAQRRLRVALRMGVYQQRFMQTPEYAAVNETIELIKAIGLNRASGLANAVLRKTHDLNLSEILSNSRLAPLQKMAVETSHPEWLLKRWLHRADEAAVRRICQFNNTIPELWARRNPLRIGILAWEQFLETAEIKWTTRSEFPDFYRLRGNTAELFHAPAFSEGWFTVQDAAAGIAPRLIDPQPGETVLDLCAAPGGKSSYLVELSQDMSQIKAFDNAPVRLEQMQMNLKRMRCSHLSLAKADVAIADLPQADKILLDVPCSGTGVLARRADLRWKRKLTDIQDLVDIQGRMLENAWRSLKPGGRLVYSTCTLEPEENEHQVTTFLAHHVDAELEPVTDEKLTPFLTENGAILTQPERDTVDGMFAVKIRKRN